ncbi:MAG TPA: histidine kinase [Anditalea sp.]|nr:histidine kinase [Anditalea sp.]
MPLAKEKRLAEIQLETLRRQLNPHFTFNAINSLQYFILKNETDLALDYLCKLSGLIRHTLDLSHRLHVSLAEEINYLKAYLAIENTRIENKVLWNIKIEKKIDTQRVHIPPMLIHPFIENIFLHSFPASHPNPEIDLDFKLLDENNISCTIKDNGIGFDPLCISEGISLVKERLRLMTSKHSQILIITSALDKGTSIKLLINYSLVL